MTHLSPCYFRSFILMAACLTSGVAGYAYGVQSAPAKESMPSKRVVVERLEPSVAVLDMMAGAKDLPVQQYDAF